MTETAIDLQRFCYRGQPQRDEKYKTPLRCKEGIVATNREILVCVPDDGGIYLEAMHPVTGAVSSIKNRIDATPADHWIEASLIGLPDSLVCRACKGSGYVHQKDCSDCEGQGEFQHGNHTYACKSCDGARVVTCAETEGKKEDCPRCHGSGEQYSLVRIGHASIQRKYLAMIKDLPAACLRAGDAWESVLFTFNGGFGAVMPCRGE